MSRNAGVGKLLFGGNCRDEIELEPDVVLDAEDKRQPRPTQVESGKRKRGLGEPGRIVAVKRDDGLPLRRRCHTADCGFSDQLHGDITGGRQRPRKASLTATVASGNSLVLRVLSLT